MYTITIPVSAKAFGAGLQWLLERVDGTKVLLDQYDRCSEEVDE